MTEKLYEIRSEFKSFNGDGCGNNGTQMAVYYPLEKTERTKIAVLAMHQSNYMGFSPMVEMAKRGFIAAGIGLKNRSRKVRDANPKYWLEECSVCIDYLKSIPGVEKVVLMAHSQGGCMLSAYQYIAENGTDRFRNDGRTIPFPEVEKLTPADGLMLLDGNYGIMDVMALDPAVRTLDNGYSRIPELDLYNPDNGYDPARTNQTYPEEFAVRFQRAQVAYYKELLAMAKERYEKIKAGRGQFLDDEIIFIPGAGGGSSNNKLFCQDSRWLGRTAKPRKLLHADGTITEEVVYTNRTTGHSTPSDLMNGGQLASVKYLLQTELRFDDDWGYDECSIHGMDEKFNYLSTRENVKGIHVPLLCEGNHASHEFVNMEITYENAVSADKDYIALAGSRHDFTPVSPEFGDVLSAVSDYFAAWLAKPGRFID